jgi:hypothetical protein
MMVGHFVLDEFYRGPILQKAPNLIQFSGNYAYDTSGKVLGLILGIAKFDGIKILAEIIRNFVNANHKIDNDRKFIDQCFSGLRFT